MAADHGEILRRHLDELQEQQVKGAQAGVEKLIAAARAGREVRQEETAAATQPKPRRGRQRGPIPRGNCPVCRRDVALRVDGSPFAHRTIAANGYTRLGDCPGGG